MLDAMRIATQGATIAETKAVANRPSARRGRVSPGARGAAGRGFGDYILVRSSLHDRVQMYSDYTL